ncbi:transporter [Sphingomonas sp. RB56-2]|uniref:Transporter n=1 Tax=Sphingomonas brevis TaxID=2908206 RepID=A0ABT0S647_9SPHN|nr:transporter [Sphingomonas brevis]MCL6739861.1 transporter [Sphingomonas brevis]
MRAIFCGALAAFAVISPADAEEAPICTDRPAKANAVCAVPVGQWQLESSPVAWARTEVDGTATRTLTLGSTVVKYGLSDRSDLQLGFVPFVQVEARSGGIKSSASTVGDVTMRYKRRLTGDKAPVQVAAIPFIKLPTADQDIGNGKVEGGLGVPVSFATGGPLTVVLGPELDLLADSDGHGRHVAIVNIVNLSGPIADGVTLYGELWAMTNFDPADTVTLASADVAIAYLATDRLQLDLGANMGLNRNTADIEIYAGVSVRF